MKRIRNLALFLGLAVGLTGALRAQSAFSGAFVFPVAPDLTAICGGVRLSISEGQVLFQSTLFQPWVVGASLEAVLMTQNMTMPLSFGVGRPGRWELGAFFGPLPGVNPVPPDEELIDPGFNLPVYSDGIRFSGSFTAPTGFENALLAGGGVMQLQIYGTLSIGGLRIQDPLISAVLLPVPEPSAIWLIIAGGIAWIMIRLPKQHEPARCDLTED